MSEVFTIAEAAERIGVSERSLRRWIADPGNAAVTRRITRQEGRRTRTGLRVATVIEAEGLEELRALLEGGARDETPATVARRKHGGNGGAPRSEDTGTERLIEALQSQLEAKDREMRERLAEQAETIEDLRRTKDALLERVAESESKLALVLAATNRLQLGPAEPQESPKEPAKPPRRSWWARIKNTRG
jgi:DNA-binding transcriptional MerR regulator